MPLIFQLHIIIGEDGVNYGGALLPYDVKCNVGGNEVYKVSTGVFITISGGVVTEHSTNVPGSEWVTKMTNQETGNVAYLREDPTYISNLLNDLCVDCEDRQTARENGDSCGTPMHTKDCDRAALMGRLTDINNSINNLEVNVGDVTIDNQGVEDRLDVLIDGTITGYNIQEHWRVKGAAVPEPWNAETGGTASRIFGPALYNSISVIVENGIGSIEMNGIKLFHKAGYSNMFTANALLSNEMIVRAESTDAVITINTIKG